MMAKGPSVNVPGHMLDPTLELHAGNGALMTSNDNWKESPNRAASMRLLFALAAILLASAMGAVAGIKLMRVGASGKGALASALVPMTT